MADDHHPDFAADFGLTDDDQDADGATIKRLADLSPLEYDRVRKTEAERMKLSRVGILDRLVQAERAKGATDTKGQGRPVFFRPPEPWPDAVDGAALLDALADYFTRHLILPTGAPIVMALWALHCHCFAAFSFTPRLQFKAPTKGAGKSTAIELIKGVVPKALETETITQAFLFRVIELAQPTVLLDEADTYLRDDEDLRGLVNAGVKPGAMAGRCVGDNQEPRLFNCHAPIALAGIGALPGTIEDRSIKIMMKRRLRSETIEPIEDATRTLAAELQRKAARWAADHASELREARPNMHPLINRAADRWRALYAVADVVACGNWPMRAREATQAIATDDDDADSLGERLLADVKAIFTEACPVTELPTSDIVERLVAMQHRPWPEMGTRRSPLTTARFTQMVGRFGIQRRRLTDGDKRPWGYRLIDFDEAFGRYLDA